MNNIYDRYMLEAVVVALDISHKRKRAALQRAQPASMQNSVVPQSVSGRYRRLKWAMLLVCLGVYYTLPFLRWERGEGQPDQAVLFDFQRIRFYFFFLEFWPRDLILVTGALILATLVLILVNALVGRTWCGYACPQTVWTDLFMLVERRIEGNRREQLRERGAPLTLRRAARKGLKHAVWLLVAAGTGGAFVLFFGDAMRLVPDLMTGNAPTSAYAAVAVLTFTTYALAGHAREQVCTWMCPWPRLQGAIWDREALTVNYRDYRGERRASAKKAELARASGEQVGDCVDCGLCVAVCPIGIDIREGPNVACINCGLCVDACDEVMTKLARPRGLVDYETWANIERGRAGETRRFRLLRPGTIALSTAVLALAGLMIASIALRADLKISVVRDSNPMAVVLSDGRIRNAYSVKLSNLTLEPRAFAFAVEGLEGAQIDIVGSTARFDAPVEIAQDASRVLRVLVSGRADEVLTLSFTLTELETGARSEAKDLFMLPGGRR